MKHLKVLLSSPLCSHLLSTELIQFSAAVYLLVPARRRSHGLLWKTQFVSNSFYFRIEQKSPVERWGQISFSAYLPPLLLLLSFWQLRFCEVTWPSGIVFLESWNYRGRQNIQHVNVDNHAKTDTCETTNVSNIQMTYLSWICNLNRFSAGQWPGSRPYILSGQRWDKSETYCFASACSSVTSETSQSERKAEGQRRSGLIVPHLKVQDHMNAL